MEENIKREIAINTELSYKLGSYLYMGMAIKNNQKVCVAVAYRINYCIKKIDQFLNLDPKLQFVHISKIKVGELKACEKFHISQPYSKYYL